MVDWYDDWIEEEETLKIRIIADTHFNHLKLHTHSVRPADFTDRIIRNWKAIVQPTDLVIHLGDVIIGPKRNVKDILKDLPGRKILVRGNHDRDKTAAWWMENGFDFAADYFEMRGILFTHEPANAIVKSNGNRPYGMLEELSLPGNATINVHGHLHNIWDGFINEERYQRDKELLGVDFKKQLLHPWQRLLAVEYTDYKPVELNEFLAHPAKYKATGPGLIEVANG